LEGNFMTGDVTIRNKRGEVVYCRQSSFMDELKAIQEVAKAL
jgi:hypothetical protein